MTERPSFRPRSGAPRVDRSKVPPAWTRVLDSSGQVRLRAEHVEPLVALLLIEAEEARRQHHRFRAMYDALPASEGADVLAYVRKMRDHWDARHGAYLALADTLAGRRYALSHVRRAEAEALVRQAERTLNKGESHVEGQDE